ncbi:uncharacterized protein V6R79_022200 [Siganus canaliculatus]
MEDGAENISAESKGKKFLAKSGWVKKAPARLLASYKDRYVHVERTEMVVYENEDLQNCLERLDLGDYDKCHELKSPFKKKHRLILIRSPKSGNKVSDVKFQLPTAEEKEAWMKALSDCISRAKNKIFDEVTVDESCNLEHVTRTRPKGNRNRRPPTRIHMKEVAIVSSDGILRLDLDLEDALMPNGTSHASTDGASSPKEVAHLPKPPSSASESTEEPSEPVSVEKAQTEPEAKTPKKIPMPPIKEAKPSTTPEDEPDKKKVLKPPMPPSKEAKPCLAAAGETTEKTDADMAEKSAPGDQEVDSKVDENEEEEDNEREEEEPDLKTEEAALPGDGDEKPENSSDEKRLSEERSEKTTSDGTNKLPPPMVPLKPSPPSASDKTDVKNTQENVVHPTEGQSPADLPEPAPDISTHSAEESEDPLSDPIADSLSLSPALWPREKTAKAEEKSVDSGQHSDDDSEGSGSEDALAAAPLGGGPACLDVVDSEGTIKMPVSARQAALATKSQVRSDALSQQHSKPIPPLKPSSKTRSASFGNLLSEEGVQAKQPARAEVQKDMASNDDVTKLEAEVALEMEKTSKLLSTMSQSQEGEHSETTSEDLLAKAMEKLTQADHVLREVKKLKIAKNSSIRKSW